jgi:glutamine synthetase
MYSENPKAKRFEFRCPDPSANGYLTFSAILMAAVDGIKNKIDPGEPLDKNIYELGEKDKKKIKSVPGSLAESLSALEKDHQFLLESGVFTQDLIDNYLEYKRDKEIDQMALRPHPYEFYLYYDN